MDAAAPEAAEPPETAEATAEPRKRSWWRVKIPTTVVVTLLGIALTAWLLPAFTRQWDDRQKVRQLQAQFADQIAVETATALARGAVAARRTSTLMIRRNALAPIETDWDIARARVELTLRTYFPPAVVRAWRDFGFEVVRFLRMCALVGIDGTNEDVRLWLGSLNLTQQELDAPRTPGLTLERLLAGTPSTPSSPSLIRAGLDATKAALLAHAGHVTAMIGDAHPEGYSTTTRDLIHDLLPF
jgi:hypothetical protein